jgi:hypothetical protein
MVKGKKRRHWLSGLIPVTQDFSYAVALAGLCGATRWVAVLLGCLLGLVGGLRSYCVRIVRAAPS